MPVSSALILTIPPQLDGERDQACARKALPIALDRQTLLLEWQLPLAKMCVCRCRLCQFPEWKKLPEVVEVAGWVPGGRSAMTECLPYPNHCPCLSSRFTLQCRLTPSANHLAEPPWVSTAILAGSLVAGTRFFLDSYEQQAGDDD